MTGYARFWAPVALMLLLPGCDSSSPEYWGVAAKNVTVDGARFSVRHTAFTAEAIRTNAMRVPGRERIRHAGATAIAMASGCRLRPGSLQGDAVVLRADLECLGAGPPPPSLEPMEFDCGFVLGIRAVATQWRDGFIDCTQVR